MLSSEAQTDGCSLWPDGIPQSIGGTGSEWLGCCLAHDTSALTIQDHLALGQCVADSGYPIIGGVMSLGLVLFCWIYIKIKRAVVGNNRQKEV